MPTITVSTPTELMAALQGAVGGETILLEGGDYGKLSLSGGGYNFPSNVTITSADPTDPGVFTGLNVQNSSNLTFDGITFDYNFQAGDPIHVAPFQVSGSQDVTIRNSTFEGDFATGVSSTADGYGYGSGMVFTGSTGITFENNEMFDFWKGLSVIGSSDAVVQGNNVHSLRSDGMNFVEVQNVTIENNHIHDFRTSPNSGDHSDMIQFWTAGTNAPSTDIVIRGNQLDIGDGSLSQTIFMGNEAVSQGVGGTAMFYQNVLIEENVIVNAHVNGIYVGQTNGLVIRNNSVLHDDGGDPDGVDSAVEIPQIGVSSTSTNVTITQNAVANIAGYNNQSGWTLSNNAFVQDQDPQAPGYYGLEFITSSLTLQNGMHQIVAVPGGMLEQLNAGALSTFGYVGQGPMALFQVADGPDGLVTRVFDASLTNDGGANTFPPGTVFEWDFGDGTTATGKVVEHDYTASGEYMAVLTVRLPDGQTDIAAAEIAIMDSALVSMLDGTGFTGGVAINDVTLGANNLALSIDRAAVEPMLNSDSFHIGWALDAASTGSSGRVMFVHGSFEASVDSAGNLVFRADTTNGQIQLKSSGVKLNDMNAHTIDVSLADDILSISIDGQTVASTTMTGTLVSEGRHDLYIGNPWQQPNFVGMVSDLTVDLGPDGAPAVPQTLVLDTTYSGPTPVPIVTDPTPVPIVTDPTPVPIVTDPTPVPVVTDPTPVPVVTDPTPVPIVTDPTPVPVVTDPTPVPIVTDPTPVPVVTDPTPVPIVTDPVPVPVVTDPTPVPVVTDPVPEPVEPDPIPVNYEPDPIPEPAEPDPIPVNYEPDPIAEPVEPDLTAPISSGPCAVPADFILDIGALDQSQLFRDATIVQTDTGPAIQMDGSRDYVDLGLLPEFEGAEQLSMVVDFIADNTGAREQRLLWNDGDIGLTIDRDGLNLHLWQDGKTGRNAIDSHKIDAPGLDDALHSVKIIADSVLDRLQVLIDGEVAFDDQVAISTFGDPGDPSSWFLGARGRNSFDGLITCVQIDESADFVETALLLDDGSMVA